MPIVGVLENMKLNKATGIAFETEKLGLKYLGSILFDPKIEASIGYPTKLLSSTLGKAIRQIKKVLVGKQGNSKCSSKQ
jgi:hypothetical protein